MWRKQESERGAVLVHVAFGLIALLGFSALSIDYGVMWASRAQAQNSADAAALAGATSLAYVDPDDEAQAKAVAALVGQANAVWGESPAIDPDTDVIIGNCPPGAPGPPDTCVRANVYRNQDAGNALPTMFARVIGVMDQGVKAMATAQILSGNAAECVKPWAVADKWAENWENGAPATLPWSPESSFDKYKKQGNQWVPDPDVAVPDVYVAPTADSPGTGFTPFDQSGNPTSYYGLPLTLKLGSSENRISSGWFLALDLPGSNAGGNDYRDNIEGCHEGVIGIGDAIDTKTGNMVGPTGQGVEALKDKDPAAVWDEEARSVKNSCAPGICADGNYYTRSPRIVPVPLFDIDDYFAGAPTGKDEVTITNIMGFFVVGMGGTGNKDVIGRLVAIPGRLQPGTETVDDTASFLRTVLLVR